MKNRTIRMAYLFSQSSRIIDPANLETIYQYELVRNLYGRLVEYDLKGQLIAGIPKSFSWKDDEVRFVFADRAKTIDGQKITAQDAEASLKRLIIRGRSGHGDIRRFLCPGHILKKLSDVCPGIVSRGDELILKVTTPHFIPLLLSTLESCDFSIIPASNILADEPNLPLKNHRNTSGPYYVAEDSENGALVLNANPNHYHYQSEMPQVVRLVPVGFMDGLGAFIRGEVDLLPSPQEFSGNEASEILTAHDNEIHRTLALKLSLVRFSPSALERFTTQQRIFAGVQAGKAYAKILPKFEGTFSSQFFQALSDGALDSAQIQQLNKLRELKVKPKFETPIQLSLGKKFVDMFASELKSCPEISVTTATSPILSLPEDERPDMYFVTNDSAWTEDFGLLGHNFSSGTFALPGLDTDKWFREYLLTNDKSERIRRLNKLHFDLLITGTFLPIYVSPYYIVAKKPWLLNQSNLSAGTELWQMRLN